MGVAEVGRVRPASVAARRGTTAAVATTRGRHSAGQSGSGTWLDEIDPVAIVRGSSSGFTVLVLGGLLAPIASTMVPVLGSYALVIAAVVGFATAAWKQAAAQRPGLGGAIAAVGAYLLVLPLVYMGQHGVNLTQVAATLATAVAVGALVGLAASRRISEGAHA